MFLEEPPTTQHLVAIFTFTVMLTSLSGGVLPKSVMAEYFWFPAMVSGREREEGRKGERERREGG